MKSWVIVMWGGCLTVAFTEKVPRNLYIENSLNTYCNCKVLRETTACSDLLCADNCRSDALCVAYSRRGSQCVLHDGFCSSSDLLTEAGARYAEVNWECFGSSCYYMSTLQRAVSKAEANAICEAMGAHVLATETKEENDLILQLVYHSSYVPIKGTSHPSIWLDLIHDITWRHSGEAATFTNWGTNEPRESDEHLTIMKEIGIWCDVDENRVYAFLCEK